MELWEIIWKSFLLGTVQGLTEFLPVSSSGHLLLLERVLGFTIGGSATFLNVMLHLGTLIAVVIVFRRDLFSLFKRPLRPLFLLGFATLPAALTGLFLGDAIDALFAGEGGLLLLALCFGVTAILLTACEYVARHRKKRAPFGAKSALSMGFMQAVAVLPGLSRSGSTIAMGVLTGASVEEASRFSFLMSVPIILGSVVVSGWKLLGAPVAGMGAAEAVGLLVGIVSAAVSGLFAIKAMLRIVRRASYRGFALYLFVLALFTLWLDLRIL